MHPEFRMAAGLAAVILSFLLSGCTGNETAPDDGLAVRDSAGVRILVSGGAGPISGRPWRLERDLDIGSFEGPSAFGRLVDVAPRRRGGLWTVDSGDRRVRGFDESGREVLAFGGAGDGPGEFRSIGSVHEAADGTLWVGTPLPLQLHRFDGAGKELGRVGVPMTAYREAPDPDGPSRPPLGPTMGTWRFGPGGRPYLLAVTLDAADGDIVRTDVLLRVDVPGEGDGEGDAGAVRLASWAAPAMTGGPGGELRLFSPTASWSPLRDGGAWVTSGETYEVRRLRPDGRPLRILRRPVPRRELSPELRTSFLEGLREAAATPAAAAMLERAVFPDSLPATLGLWTTADDHLWVGVLDPSLPLRREAPNALDVFGPDGHYLGRLPIPVGLRPTRITADHVYGIWLDDLEIPHARRYRIVRGE